MSVGGKLGGIKRGETHSSRVMLARLLSSELIGDAMTADVHKPGCACIRTHLTRRLQLLLGGLVLMAALALVQASPALAASRYAAPTAQGSGDCSSPANACTIYTAVSGASPGDNIYVLANHGNYNLASGVNPGSTTLHFHGIDGRPRLLDSGNDDVLTLNAPSSSADNLYLESLTSNGNAISAHSTSGTVSLNRLFAKSGQACYFGGGVTLTDSICWGNGTYTGGPALETDCANTLRNDDVWNSAPGGSMGIRDWGRDGCNGDDVLINTIVRDTGSGSSDLYANAASPYTATFYVRHSNFGTTLAAGDTALDHFNTNNTDQKAFPKLVNPALGNFHELHYSPTANKGITSPANGKVDLDGHPRSVKGKTDIGAYELKCPSDTDNHGNDKPGDKDDCPKHHKVD